MSDIQVDMFEVQLGAGLLLQFRFPSGQIVRVLADAGVKASGYPKDHVLQKLNGIFSGLPEGERRIDLIIGTHYDADHLDGLVPIIADQSIEIGEAWLPPVANDVGRSGFRRSVDSSQMLAFQFADDGGDRVLIDYLRAKRENCEQIRRMESIGDDIAIRARQTQPLSDSHLLHAMDQEPDGDGWRQYFKAELGDASRRAGMTSTEHADHEISDPSSVATDQLINGSIPFSSLNDQAVIFSRLWQGSPSLAEVQRRSLADIRKSQAEDAIRAVSLNDVVVELKRREIPIRCETIPHGEPRRFVWHLTQRRFIPAQRTTSTGLEVKLLGPSNWLVEKNRDRLPIGTYMAVVARSPIPIKPTTPSNELSYVARFEFMEQGILVAGDAACVDFAPPGSRSYFDPLLQALMPLHVIQVAHHGGANGHFYRVLLASNFAEQDDSSYLLLSHETDDKHRPSDAFGQFVEAVRKDGDDVSLVFTSKPLREKVKDYVDIIHPLAGGPANDRGDARLTFDTGSWNVVKHSIRV